ncbi:hypothetical protein [Bythopirellula polymerisocia]|nr:hypothetical protein [Bythopirellula polymerisocia]
MQTILCRIVCWCSVVGLISAVHAAEITPIASLGLGVSGNGAIVVGAAEGVGGDAGYILVSRWTSVGGVQTLGRGSAYDISQDGTTLVGERQVGDASRPFRWTAEQGFTDLGILSGGNGFANAIDVSSNGDVVVGLASQATGFRGFRWTPQSGMTALGDLPGGFDYSQANSISADGQITVGVSTGSSGDRAVRWIGANTTPLDMGLPPGLTGFTEAKGVSGNGEVIVGVWGDGIFTNEAFRWTLLGGYELLDDLPGGLLDSVATQTNFDGSVIVGTGNPGDAVPDEAFYWTESTGMRSLREVLLDAGADLSAWRTLDTPTSLSDDGRVIVGTGTLIDGTVAGFRVCISVPEPTGLALLLVGSILAFSKYRPGNLAQRENCRRQSRFVDSVQLSPLL